MCLPDVMPDFALLLKVEWRFLSLPACLQPSLPESTLARPPPHLPAAMIWLICPSSSAGVPELPPPALAAPHAAADQAQAPSAAARFNCSRRRSTHSVLL